MVSQYPCETSRNGVLENLEQRKHLRPLHRVIHNAKGFIIINQILKTTKLFRHPNCTSIFASLLRTEIVRFVDHDLEVLHHTSILQTSPISQASPNCHRSASSLLYRAVDKGSPSQSPVGASKNNIAVIRPHVVEMVYEQTRSRKEPANRLVLEIVFAIEPRADSKLTMRLLRIHP
jgi:hypothetical protein